MVRSLYEEQARLLAVKALKIGIPKNLISKVIDIADSAHLLGRADQQIKREKNREEYQLDLNSLEEIARYEQRESGNYE